MAADAKVAFPYLARVTRVTVDWMPAEAALRKDSATGTPTEGGSSMTGETIRQGRKPEAGAKSAPGFVPDDRHLSEWMRDRSAELRKNGGLGQQWAMIDLFWHQIERMLDLGRGQTQEDWYVKIQVHAILFNLGLVISAHCAPFQTWHGSNSDSLFDLNRDVVAALSKAETWRRPLPVTYAIAFLRKFLAEIRGHVCAGDAVKAPGNAATSVAAWLQRRFGMLEPAAVGGAAMILALIDTAARDSFCTMSEGEFFGRLDT